jgi:conjugative relaxase-like TrwC/TraI family protein
VRFTITALGSAGGRTVGQVVDDIVAYLEPRPPRQPGPGPAVPEGDGPCGYYADRGTEPGRWLGFGASEAGLRGGVSSADFARVLAGRDPRTGARLITAQGSAGRKPTLGAGTETRRGRDGVALYGVADVAAALGVSHTDAEAMIAAGERAAIRSVLSSLTGASSGEAEPEAAYVVPRVDRDGTRWVIEPELDRAEAARARGVPPGAVAAAGGGDDLLSVAHASRLAGLTGQYLRSLCRRYENHKADIDAARRDGRAVRRAYVVAYRGTKGQWLIRRADLVAFLQRRVAPAVRVGFDLTLTTEKSLGVLALLSDDHTRAAVLAAIEAGNDRGLAHFEHHGAGARRKGEQVGVRGVTVASFRHLTSRALDPFPHHHNVVANTVVDEYGTRRALDARGLYRHAQAASALATAEMRHRLTRSLGLRWRPGRSGGWEVDGIDDDTVREFSRRRSEIDDAVAELEEAIGRRSNLHELQAIVTATRPAKQEIDPARLVAGWWERAATVGLTPHGLAACTGREPVAQVIDPEWIFTRLVDPERGLCARSSMFTRSDVLSALVDLPVPCTSGPDQPLLMPADDLERLTDRFLAGEHVIPLAPQGLPPGSALTRDELFSTPEILRAQQRILDRYRAGARTGAATVPADVLTRALASAAHLTGEQRDLVRSFCTSGHRIQCAIGRAGAGKTTTMRAAAEAWTAAGYRVVGTAVKGEAARHLATGAGIPTETVAWYLARADRPSLPLDDRTVLVVDEASTVSDRDLDALLALAEAHGAAVRLIGDPDQHGAVAAGGMFAHLCNLATQDTPELAVTHRLTDPAERAAVDELRRGHINQALDRLEAAGRLHIAEDDLDLYIGMLERWWHAHHSGDHHPMVDRRHHTRRRLNRLARQLLRANGELGEVEIHASDNRAFATGDRVVARMAARHLHAPGDPGAYIRNGAAGTSPPSSPGGSQPATASASTSTGSAPSTSPAGSSTNTTGPAADATSASTTPTPSPATPSKAPPTNPPPARIDEHASRAEAYVDLTRGRNANHLFLTRAPEPLDGEHLPKVPPPPIADNVARRLRESGPERAAIEVDPAAGRLASLPHPTLTDTTTAHRVRSLRADRASRLARYDPPADLLTHLPQRPEAPHLAKRWDDTITAIVNYRAHWNTTPTHGRFAWALGAPLDQPDAAAQRNCVIERIVRLVSSTAGEELRRHGCDQLPPWAHRHLAEQAALGSCTTDPAHLSGPYERVAGYRRTRGLDDDTGTEHENLAVAMLGPRPATPVEATQHDLLRHEITATLAPARSTERGIA